MSKAIERDLLMKLYEDLYSTIERNSQLFKDAGITPSVFMQSYVEAIAILSIYIISIITKKGHEISTTNVFIEHFNELIIDNSAIFFKGKEE